MSAPRLFFGIPLLVWESIGLSVHSSVIPSVRRSLGWSVRESRSHEKQWKSTLLDKSDHANASLYNHSLTHHWPHGPCFCYRNHVICFATDAIISYCHAWGRIYGSYLIWKPCDLFCLQVQSLRPKHFLRCHDQGNKLGSYNLFQPRPWNEIEKESAFLTVSIDEVASPVRKPC